MSGFDTALSGIQAAGKDLDVIGNNIANSATVGFKGSRAEFADIYNSSTYGTGTNAVGGGVRLSRVHQLFTGGNITATGNTLDLSINGSGFFCLSDQGSRVYSRAGQFKLDKTNHIVNASNQRLVGFLADTNGGISAVSGELQISMQDITPKPSSLVTAGMNLLAGATPPASDWTGGPTPPVDSYNNVTTSPIYDSLGNQHILTMYFIHANPAAASGAPNASSPPGQDNQWYVAFQIDNQNVPANTGPNNTDNLFRANFNPDGSFAGVNDVTGAPLANNRIPLTMTLTNGANPLNFAIDLSNATQFGSPFAVQSMNNDGYTTGSLSSLGVDDTGVIFGNYSNGQLMAMGQIQLAKFTDPESLQNIGNTTWTETLASGPALVAGARTAGLGAINSGSLEESNVDLTNELVKLIGAQRNFQANAQTIRTTDAITQTIINIR